MDRLEDLEEWRKQLELAASQLEQLHLYAVQFIQTQWGKEFDEVEHRITVMNFLYDFIKTKQGFQ